MFPGARRKALFEKQILTYSDSSYRVHVFSSESKSCKFCLVERKKKVAKVSRQALGILMQAIRSNKAVIDYHYLLLGFIVCHTLWGIYLLIVNWSVEAQLVLSLLI